jgi:WD repeat-containing protein 89
VIGGTSAGTTAYFPVRNDPVGAIGSAEAILEGGHTGVLRTICPAGSSHQGLGQNMGISGWRSDV